MISSGILETPGALVRALEALRSREATALQFLAEAERRELVTAARGLAFRRATPVVGPAGARVFQDFDVAREIPKACPIAVAATRLGWLIDDAFKATRPCLYEHSFAINDVIAQRYPTGSRGISPHRDHLCYEGVVAILVLQGGGHFCTAGDRGGRDLRETPAAPGDLILMRAVGFAGERKRPFHSVLDIERERLTVGCRYDARGLPLLPQCPEC